MRIASFIVVALTVMLLVTPLTTQAQPAAKVYRLGILSLAPPTPPGTYSGTSMVEQPTVFGLAINLKTAKALGLTFPQSVQSLVDRDDSGPPAVPMRPITSRYSGPRARDARASAAERGVRRIQE